MQKLGKIHPHIYRVILMEVEILSTGIHGKNEKLPLLVSRRVCRSGRRAAAASKSPCKVSISVIDAGGQAEATTWASLAERFQVYKQIGPQWLQTEDDVMMVTLMGLMGMILTR